MPGPNKRPAIPNPQQKVYKMKHKKIIMLVASGLIIISLAAIITNNDRLLGGFSRQLFSLKLPEKTSLIETRNICGKLNGNGNSMDFLACILIETELDIHQLEEYYENIKFKSVKKERGYSPQAKMVKLLGNKLETEYLKHGSIVFSGINEKLDSEKYFVVFIYDGGYESFDIRGH